MEHEKRWQASAEAEAGLGGGYHHVAQPAPCSFATLIITAVLAAGCLLAVLMHMPYAGPGATPATAWRRMRSQGLRSKALLADDLLEYSTAANEAGHRAHAPHGAPQLAEDLLKHPTTAEQAGDLALAPRAAPQAQPQDVAAAETAAEALLGPASSGVARQAATAETAAEAQLEPASSARQAAAAETVAPGDDLAAAALAPKATQHMAVDWASCLREDDTKTPFTANDFLHSRPARVRVEAVLTSRQPRSPAAITMFVAATASRLDYLDALCTSWRSVITLAYYIAVPANATDPAAVIRDDICVIRRKFDQLEVAGDCQLDVVAVSERVDSMAAMLFPINVLRNLALLMAQTELVMLGDMDMLIGTGLRDIVTGDNGTSLAKYQQLLGMTANRRLVVVPTFQTWVLEWAVAAAEGGKDAAVRLWDGDNFRYFLQGGYEPAHQDTDVARWVNATEGYELSDTGQYFEPWWIARRADIAPYDVRYRGYGKNKVQHLQELLADLGFRFMVHPRAYMVHRPHGESAAKQQADAEYAERKKREAAGDAPTVASAEAQLQFSLVGMTQRWLEEQFDTPPPHSVLVCAGWRRCRDSLPFWNVYGASGEPMRTVANLDEGQLRPSQQRRQLHDTHSSGRMFGRRMWQLLST